MAVYSTHFKVGEYVIAKHFQQWKQRKIISITITTGYRNDPDESGVIYQINAPTRQRNTFSHDELIAIKSK